MYDYYKFEFFLVVFVIDSYYYLDMGVFYNWLNLILSLVVCLECCKLKEKFEILYCIKDM